MSERIHVIFRACDAVSAVNNNPRPFNLSKREIVMACFKSMLASIQDYDHTITVLGDKLSPELMDFFLAYDVQLSNGSYGNDESIRQSIKKSLEFTDNDWVYFCEDDYLHTPNCFMHIKNLLNERERIYFSKKNLLFKYEKHHPEIAIHPPDYPDRYRNKPRDRGFLFHSSTCHWRQVANSTFTLMMQVKSIRKFERQLIKSSIGANDRYLSESIYGTNDFRNKLLCLSPVPGLANHMHRDTVTPLVDWKSILEKYR